MGFYRDLPIITRLGVLFVLMLLSDGFIHRHLKSLY